jgi:hypothetical protein
LSLMPARPDHEQRDRAFEHPLCGDLRSDRITSACAPGSAAARGAFAEPWLVGSTVILAPARRIASP